MGRRHDGHRGTPFGPGDFPSRLEIRPTPEITARMQAGAPVGLPFVLGEVEFRNGIIVSISPVSCDLEIRSAEPAIQPLFLPVQLENTANIEGDPIGSADRILLGTILADLPPSVYHR